MPCDSPALGMGASGIVLKMMRSQSSRDSGAAGGDSAAGRDDGTKCCVKIVVKDKVLRLYDEFVAHTTLKERHVDVNIFAPMADKGFHIEDGT